MTDISAEYKKMLQELDAELNPTPAADEFTTYQYADANTMTRDAAHYLL